MFCWTRITATDNGVKFFRCIRSYILIIFRRFRQLVCAFNQKFWRQIRPGSNRSTATLLAVGFPIRISSVQRLLAPPRSFSQPTTSFIDNLRQGIRYMRLCSFLWVITPMRQTYSFSHRAVERSKFVQPAALFFRGQSKKNRNFIFVICTLYFRLVVDAYLWNLTGSVSTTKFFSFLVRFLWWKDCTKSSAKLLNCAWTKSIWCNRHTLACQSLLSH